MRSLENKKYDGRHAVIYDVMLSFPVPIRFIAHWIPVEYNKSDSITY